MSEPDKELSPPEMGVELESITTTRVKDEGFWRELWFQARLVWHLLRSPDVPFYLKLFPVVAVIYVLVPTDLMPDVFPLIGQLDDLTALLVGAKIFIELSPQDVVAHHRQIMREAQRRARSQSDSQEGDSLTDAIIIEGEYELTDESD